MIRLRRVTPHRVAWTIVDGRLGDADPERRGDTGAVDLATYQREAAAAARRILDERRGVLLADSVGLGKTFVALALVEDALRRGERVAVVTPAALQTDWSRHLRRLARALGLAGVAGLSVPRTGQRDRGRGADLDAGPASRTSPRAASGAFLAWVSHARLSRGTYPADRLSRLHVVVVDEAHAFRTPTTRRYRALAGLCRDARVVLITATPVNNSLMDLYHLLRLFSGDAGFRDLGIVDLGAAFRAAAADSSGSSGFLAPLLRAVVVRRTRRLLGQLYPDADVGGKRLGLPARAPPVVVRYDLGASAAGSGADLMAELEALTLAPLRLADYGFPFRSRAGAGEAELVRLGLLKRLESSAAAFHVSIARHLRFYEQFLNALASGRLLVPADFRGLYASGDADSLQLVLEPVALARVPAGLDVERLAADARVDLHRLAALERLLRTVGPETDSKLARLRELLDGELRHRKTVLFTEFRDTAAYLWRQLRDRGHVGMVHGSGAYLGRQSYGRRGVVERFAPRCNGARPPPARERVDLLIATDVLAEGLNLQDADHVICYDLPWNPVRIIQRVGRVDRLGSPHPVVRTYNFVPDRALEAMLGLLARLRRKILAIGASVGVDGPVLEPDPTAPDPDAVLRRWAHGDGGALDEIERADAAPYEPLERLRAVHRAASGGRMTRGHRARAPTHANVDGAGAREQGRAGEAAPYAAVVDQGGRDRVLVSFAVGDRGPHAWLVVHDDGSFAPDAEADAAPVLGRILEGHATPCAPERDVVVRAVQAAHTELRNRLAGVAATSSGPATGTAARAARRVRRALAATPGGPDQVMCRRADAVLARLAGSLDAGTEAAVRKALRVSPSGAGPCADSGAGDESHCLRAEYILGALECALGVRPRGNGEIGCATPAEPQGATSLAASPGYVDGIRLVGALQVRMRSAPGGRSGMRNGPRDRARTASLSVDRHPPLG